MTDIIFNGVIKTTTNKNDFMNAFQQFLNQHNAQFKGQCGFMEFEDVEYIETHD